MTFDAMETLERHRDSIDKLTSLVSKTNVKIDKRDTPYKPRVTNVDLEARVWNRQQTYQSCNRSFCRDRYRGREASITIIGPIIDPNYRDRSRDQYRHVNRRNNFQSGDWQNNVRQDSRRDNFCQNNRNRSTYRGHDSQQRYRDRGESRDRSRNYDSGNREVEIGHRDRQARLRTRTLFR